MIAPALLIPARQDPPASRYGCKENPPRAMFVGFGKLYKRPASRNNRRGHAAGRKAGAKKNA